MGVGLPAPIKAARIALQSGDSDLWQVDAKVSQNITRHGQRPYKQTLILADRGKSLRCGALPLQPDLPAGTGWSQTSTSASSFRVSCCLRSLLKTYEHPHPEAKSLRQEVLVPDSSV